MHKHSVVNRLVMNLTNNPFLQTHFTAFLLAQTIAEKRAIEQQFWAEMNALPPDDNKEMRQILQIALLKLPQFTADLNQCIADFKPEQRQKLAA
jgi:hypothetical protein